MLEFFNLFFPKAIVLPIKNNVFFVKQTELYIEGQCQKNFVKIQADVFQIN